MTDGSKTIIRAPCSQSSAICPLISETKLMYKETENNGTSAEELPAIIRQRAYNLMFTGKMMCSEAVLSVLNQGIGGGLPPDLAIKMTAGLAEGIGGSGCTCGALTGGVISLGFFSPTALLNRLAAVKSWQHPAGCIMISSFALVQPVAGCC